MHRNLCTKRICCCSLITSLQVMSTIRNRWLGKQKKEAKEEEKPRRKAEREATRVAKEKRLKKIELESKAKCATG